MPDEFINQLRTNNAIWSAFRTHRMQNDIASKLIDENGQLKPFRKWIEDIKGMTNHYVRPWLQTEYSTAVLRAHQAADWKHFEAEQDIFPNVRWMPTTSPQQDPLHRQYWESKLTLPINHPFWEKHRPGDRWNCKCTLQQTDDPTNDEVIRDFYPVPQQPGLDNNPGKDGKLFSDSHPYITKAYAGAKKAVKKRFQKESTVVPKPSKRQKTEEEKTIIKTRWDARQAMRTNMREVAQKLGVEVPISSMSFKEANEGRANPFFMTKKRYWMENCQCCVITNELRRRGFKVRAMPMKWKAGSVPVQLARNPEDAWIDPITGLKPTRIKCGGNQSFPIIKVGTIESFANDLSAATKTSGRYFLSYHPKGGRYGHIITAERLQNGDLRLYDPQTGDVVEWNDLTAEMKLSYGAKVFRVDNLHVNTDVIKGAVLTTDI